MPRNDPVSSRHFSDDIGGSGGGGGGSDTPSGSSEMAALSVMVAVIAAVLTVGVAGASSMDRRSASASASGSSKPWPWCALVDSLALAICDVRAWAAGASAATSPAVAGWVAAVAKVAAALSGHGKRGGLGEVAALGGGGVNLGGVASSPSLVVVVLAVRHGKHHVLGHQCRHLARRHRRHQLGASRARRGPF